jgi:two-component system chemotaxis sensor kinase CheA
MVDLLLGQHQTVIKPLGRLLSGLRGISGSTILGNGEVALIIDVGALGDLAATTKTEERARAAPADR